MRAAWSALPLLIGAYLSPDAVAPSTPHTPQGDTATARELASGVAYRQFTDASRPWVMHLVRVDLWRADLEVRHARAFDQLRGREKPTDMVRRAMSAGTTVLTAVNADFFWLATGENENNQVIDGEWWKGLVTTDSPYDTFDNAHVQFGIDAARRPMMDRFTLDGTAWAHGVPTPIITVNFSPSGTPQEAAFYTSRFGTMTPRDTSRRVIEAPMVAAGRRGDTLLYVRRGAASATSGSSIPVGGAVLVALGTGSSASQVQAMAEGDTVKLLLATLPRPGNDAVPVLIIGGWPRILRDGVSIAGESATLEDTISSNTNLRHPRTAVGFSRDSATLYLLTVAGRTERSVGMTIAELAVILQRLGAWQAMNLDGGGSTTMVIDGLLANAPSDPTGERAVGNALFVVRKP